MKKDFISLCQMVECTLFIECMIVAFFYIAALITGRDILAYVGAGCSLMLLFTWLLWTWSSHYMEKLERSRKDGADRS